MAVARAASGTNWRAADERRRTRSAWRWPPSDSPGLRPTGLRKGARRSPSERRWAHAGRRSANPTSTVQGGFRALSGNKDFIFNISIADIKNSDEYGYDFY